MKKYFLRILACYFFAIFTGNAFGSKDGFHFPSSLQIQAWLLERQPVEQQLIQQKNEKNNSNLIAL
ncbi:MAG: hypothetical protein WCJ62_10875, partial [Flavobacterium sp.]